MSNKNLLSLFLGIGFDILLSIFLTFPAHATGLFRLESETLNSFRRNEQNKLEVPIYELVSASYMTDKKDLEINSNFSLSADPTGNNTNRANLYIMDARFVVVPERMSIRLGRTFDVIDTIGAASVDLVSADFFALHQQLRFGTFWGIEHHLDSLDSNLKSNIAGARIDYHTDEAQSLFLASKFVQRINTSNHNYEEDLVQFSGKKTMAAAWSPELIFDSESDLKSSNLNRLEVGTDLYPTINTFSKVRLMTYNVLPQTGVEQPIYTIFATGPLYEARFNFEKKFSSFFTGGFTVFYDDYQLLTNQRATGTGGELEEKFYFDLGSHLSNTTYSFQSYGGNAIGDRVMGTMPTSSKNEVYGLIDATYYEKITSSKRGAFTFETGWSKIIARQYKLTLGAQASSNNTLKDDFRSLAKLTYLLWDEI